jgi:hypothetical protein
MDFSPLNQDMCRGFNAPREFMYDKFVLGDFVLMLMIDFSAVCVRRGWMFFPSYNKKMCRCFKMK